MTKLWNLVLAFFRTVDRITLWASLVNRWLILIIAGLMFYEVMVRYIFKNPTGWSFDATIMLGGVFFLFGASYTMLTESHIRIDLIYGRLRRSTQMILDLLFGLALMLPSLGIVVYWSWSRAMWSFEVREVSQFSYYNLTIWPFRILLAIGFSLLILQCLSWFVRQLRVLTSGREVVAEVTIGGEK